MDQIRTFLRVLWQQRFWVLSGLGIIIAAVCWKLAASALDAQFRANKGVIEGKFGEMRKISSDQVRGNDAVNARETSEAVIIRDKVLDLWTRMYESQRQNALKWSDKLGNEFLGEVKDKVFRDPITNVNMLELYREYAKEQFPALVEIVQARKMADPTAGFGGEGMGRGGYEGGRPGGGYAPTGEVMLGPDGLPLPQEDYIVEWLDQGALQFKLDFKARPTSLQIWVTQEDLWVYETLLRAIADTNEGEGATRPDNAAIAAIVSLQVGKEAALAFSEGGLMMKPPSAGMGEGGAMGMEGGMTMGIDGGRGGYEGGMSMGVDGAAADPDVGLLAYRYIGDDGKPISDETTAVSPGAQFRRLPIRVVLMMEYEAIPKLVIEFANATLPIEVTRIRVNKDKSETGAGMRSPFTAAPGGLGGGEGGRGGYGGGDSGGGYRGGGGYEGGGRGGEGAFMSAAPLGASTRTDLATVEIHGIVYIYNPPDKTTLSVPGEPAADPGSIAGAGVATDVTVAR